ncbi:FIST signal transduction protein [Ideonella sp.]|uniref:FIST signal transduction protein n=1 Tax=Ideonella sp. TaxID=1929293 RepID=UPI003BB6DD60
MSGFLLAHVTHPDASMALALVAAQLDAQRAQRPAFRPTLGLLYLTDRHAAQAEAVLAEARQRWPGLHLAGTVGIGVAATGVEYMDEPAMAMLLMDLPPDSFRLFNGRQPLDGLWEDRAWTALVHADPTTPDIGELISELADRTGAHYLFGGLSSARTRTAQWADEVFHGGLSGVAFGQDVPLISRVTQGCQPIGPTRTITAAERNLVLTLDGQPALPLLLADLGMGLDPPAPLMRRLRGTLAGLTDAGDQARGRGGQFGADTRVRHLIGLDPNRQALALADVVSPGMQLAFCERHVEAARRDLVRICAEIRDEAAGDEEAGVPARRMAGALYVSCTGRGGAHFGGPSAELQLVQHALGDVPLVGFFAAGEIGGHHLYGYTGVLTVWLQP